jgi:predicted ester cyclase
VEVDDAERTPKDTVLAFLRRAEDGDPDAFDLVATDFVQHAAGPQGREGFRRTAQVLDHDLGPLTGQVHHVLADGDTVVVHLTLHGRHRASTMPLLTGVPVTDRPVTWAFVHLFRVAEGRIAEHWACRDDVGLLAQLGAWPAAPGPR